MITVGCDFHPNWQQVAIFDLRLESSFSRSWRTAMVQQSGFIVRFRRQRELALRRAVTHSGSKICWMI